MNHCDDTHDWDEGGCHDCGYIVEVEPTPIHDDIRTLANHGVTLVAYDYPNGGLYVEAVERVGDREIVYGKARLA